MSNLRNLFKALNIAVAYTKGYYTHSLSIFFVVSVKFSLSYLVGFKVGAYYFSIT